MRSTNFDMSSANKRSYPANFGSRVKINFPLFGVHPSLSYLDNASTTQKPDCVINVMQDFYESYNANVHRGFYGIAEKATEAFERARHVVASFVNASSSELIFTRGTTDSINMFARMVESRIKKGDRVVVTEMEHHSNFVPWQQLCIRTGAKLEIIPVTAEGVLNMAVAKKIFTRPVSVFAFSHASNVLGTINDVSHLVKLATSANALILLDVAQSVAHLPVDFKLLGVDALAFSAHKMYGPTGVGALVVKKSLLSSLEPVVFGGGMISEVKKEDSSWFASPWCFEAGTPPIAEVIGFASAVEFLSKLAMKKIFAFEKKLSDYAVALLSKESNVQVFAQSVFRVPVVSFVVSGVHPHDVADICAKKCVAVRGGHHCAMPLMSSLNYPQGVCRVSFAVYNTLEDVDRLIIAIREVKRVFA